MQGVRGSNPLSSTPGQRPSPPSTVSESPASGSKSAAICSAMGRSGPPARQDAAGCHRCPRPVDPGRTGPPAGRSFATKDRIGWAITDCPGGFCADRGFRRSRPTVGAEGMRSSIVAFTRTDQHTFAPMNIPSGVAGALSGERLAVLLFSPMPTVTDNRGRHHSDPPMTGPIDLPMPGQLMALPLGLAAVARPSAG
jgi:hypothetical protein